MSKRAEIEASIVELQGVVDHIDAVGHLTEDVAVMRRRPSVRGGRWTPGANGEFELWSTDAPALDWAERTLQSGPRYRSYHLDPFDEADVLDKLREVCTRTLAGQVGPAPVALLAGGKPLPAPALAPASPRAAARSRPSADAEVRRLTAELRAATRRANGGK